MLLVDFDADERPSTPGYCVRCRFSYVPDYAPDVREHRKRHDLMLRGVKAPPLVSDIVLAEQNKLRLTLVTPQRSRGGPGETCRLILSATQLAKPQNLQIIELPVDALQVSNLT
jgi:hypothetical protein